MKNAQNKLNLHLPETQRELDELDEKHNVEMKINEVSVYAIL